MSATVTHPRTLYTDSIMVSEIRSKFLLAVAMFTASRKHSYVAIFTATVAVNIAMWIYYCRGRQHEVHCYFFWRLRKLLTFVVMAS